MCGIAGVFDYQQQGVSLSPTTLDRMVDALAHRGPNGRGIWSATGISLGHRRLSVLDPTAAGAQPMVYRSPGHCCSGVDFGNRLAGRWSHRSGANPDSMITEPNLVVTYNGEIYNFRDIRRQLERLGHSFDTNCDTEVLLASFAEWGTAAVQRFNGIFAFALFDVRTRLLWLVRDRMGIKPLYFSTQGGVLRFASEVKAILADPQFQRRPNLAGIDAFLSFGFIPAPETGFQDIQQLPPASELIVQDGRITQRNYWKLQMTESKLTQDEAQQEFATRFSKAVRQQLVSDVPIGGFLSGGIDSAAVVHEMTRANEGAGRIRTFSAGFEESTFDERSAAAATAKLLGTDHTELLIKLDLDETVERFLEMNDDPFADSSSLAVYHLCREAAKRVTVALSGDGADEMLAGYSTYSATILAAGYRQLPNWSRSLLKHVVHAIPASNSRYNFQQFASRFVAGAEQPEGRDFGSWRIHFDGSHKSEMVRPHFQLQNPDPVGLYANQYHSAPGAGTRLKKMLHADLTFYLPGDMLVKVDRMSMAHGLEVRVPFLDHELVEFCAALPDAYLSRLPFPKQNKLILRRHLQKELGQNLSKRKKTGFNIPIEKAMRGSLWGRFYDTVSSTRFMQEGPFDVPKLLKHAARHATFELDAGHALFSALVLADWWERWLHG